MSDLDSNLDPRRWRALFVIALAQLMVVLDASIVNIALPKAALDLHISPQNYQWTVTAYLLTFGGFLLLGGRIADFVGRRKVFMFGLSGFAAASVLGGVAQNQGMLYGARALQGLFGALLAPAALSLISVIFTDSKERAKAFAVYGALSGVGASIGLILGGALTQYWGWRWCLFVNAPLAVVAVLLAVRNVTESRVPGDTRYDVPGALTATFGMLAVVYGVSEASTYGWHAVKSWGFIVPGVVLLALFVFIESKVTNPLFPLRLLTRIRSGAYVTQLISATGLYGLFLFMTFYFQDVLGYSAVKAGLCFLPFSLGIIVSATVASQLLPKVGPRPLGTVGLSMGAIGLLLLSTLNVHVPYFTHVALHMLTMSLGLGQVFVASSSTALFNTPPHDTGAASALLNTTQQVGGSFGTAVQNTIYATALASYLAAHHIMGKPSPAQLGSANVHGFDMAFRFGSLALALSALVFFVMVNIDRHHLGQHDDVASAFV